MSKRVIAWIIIGVVIVILVLGGWWYFSITKSTTISTQSSDNSISSFTFSGINLGGNETIDNANHTVAIFVPYGTDVTKLTPIISVTGFATISPASGVTQDFTNPIIYTITASDGLAQDYKVTVSVLSNPATDAGS